MFNLLKKHLKKILLVLLTTVLAGTGTAYGLGAFQALDICSNGATHSTSTDAFGGFFTYVVSSASTTLICLTERADIQDLNLYVSASTTGGVISYTIEVSPNKNCKNKPEDCHWYGETNLTNNTNRQTTHSGTTTTHVFEPLTASTTLLNTSLNPSTAVWTRYIFGIFGDNAAINVKILKRERNN